MIGIKNCKYGNDPLEIGWGNLIDSKVSVGYQSLESKNINLNLFGMINAIL